MDGVPRALNPRCRMTTPYTATAATNARARNSAGFVSFTLPLLSGKRPQSNKNRDPNRMRSVGRLQCVRNAVGRKLCTDGGGKVRNEIEIAVVSQGICLNVPHGFFSE